MADYGMRIQIENDNNARSWNEIFYFSVAFAPGTPAFDDFLRLVAEKRVKALVSTNYLDTITFWPLLNPTLTTIYTYNLEGQVPAAAADAQDVAPVASHIQLTAGAKRRQYLMRGVADADIRNGIFNPRVASRPLYAEWLAHIVDAPLQMRVTTFGPSWTIASINSTTITLAAGPTVDVPKKTLLTVRTRIAGGGPPVATRIRSKADSLTGSLSFLVDWRNGNCTGGDVRVATYALSPYTSSLQRSAARTRKTGGPTTRFRGAR